MADADEDLIPRPQASQGAADDPSYDPEDETQDFRFLASLLPSGAQNAGTLPKRGEKDFEPNPTKTQASILAASREAMHNALSIERVHGAKNACIGQYLPDPTDWRYDDATEVYGKGARCVVVERFRGIFNKTVGREDFRGWTWLLPEEALFLLERGSLDIRWPAMGVETLPQVEIEDASNSEREQAQVQQHADQHTEDGRDVDSIQDRELEASTTSLPTQQDNGEDHAEKLGDARPKDKTKWKWSIAVGELPMSLQGAYASLIGKSGLTPERYTVYAALKRLGYIVQRAPTWDDGSEIHSSNGHLNESPSQPPLPLQNKYSTPSSTGLIQKLLSWLSVSPQRPSQYNPSHGPLLRPGIYRSYNDIFRTLSLIPHNNAPDTLSTTNSQPKTPYIIHFTVLKPSTTSQSYKKSSPPPPDFRICVLDARTTTPPTLSQISTLLDSMPEDILPRDRKMELRLKHGRRNVILAIVDAGITSYLRISDSGFADIGKVFEEKFKRGSKGGAGRGRGGFRGRGGARGRGTTRGRG